MFLQVGQSRLVKLSVAAQAVPAGPTAEDAIERRTRLKPLRGAVSDGRPYRDLTALRANAGSESKIL